MKKMKPFVSVVVVGFNGEKFIAKLLESLESQSYPRNRFEVILVDNASTDNTSKIAESFQKAEIIQLKENTGFAAGNNEGISLDNSSKNIIRKNRIFYNKRGFLADKKSVNNLIEKNEINENRQYGVYLYGEANENVIRGNIMAFNNVGLYIKTNGNEASDNQIDQNQVGIYILGKANKNVLDSNKITYSDSIGVYAKVFNGLPNFFSDNNVLEKNAKKDIAAYALE